MASIKMTAQLIKDSFHRDQSVSDRRIGIEAAGQLQLHDGVDSIADDEAENDHDAFEEI